MKFKLMVIILILAGGLFLFSRNQESAVASKANRPIINKKPHESATHSMSDAQVVPNNAQEPLSAEAHTESTEKGKPEGDQLLVNFDQKGQQKNIQLKSERFIQDLLDSKDSLNPSLEFESLQPIDFKDQESTLLTGVFFDESLKLGLSLSWVNETLELTGSSCLLLPKGQLITAESGQFEVRADDQGYALIRIGNEYFLRLTYFVGSKRALVGKLLQKKDQDWQLISSLNAQELEVSKVRAACPFKPNMVPGKSIDM